MGAVERENGMWKSFTINGISLCVFHRDVVTGKNVSSLFFLWVDINGSVDGITYVVGVMKKDPAWIQFMSEDVKATVHFR